MNLFEVLRLAAGFIGGILAGVIVMLVRERNNFAAKMMELFLEDKNAWSEERKQLESRIDYLYKRVDDLSDKLVLVSNQHQPVTILRDPSPPAKE